MKALAVDIGGTHANCGIVEDERILAHESVDLTGTKSILAVLSRLTEVFCRLIERQSLSFEDFAGIAVGFPGLVDSRLGKVVSTNKKYDDAPKVDFCGWAADAFRLPLRIENDARLALLGESHAGAARGFSDVVMITLGTGIGGVAMIEGKLLRGKHAQAGCLGGHIPVLFNGRPCTCGGIGCAEAEASGWALPEILKDQPGFADSRLSQRRNVGFKHLFDEAEQGDKVAIAVRDRCLHIWAADAVALIHAYDPEIVVIGGGVMQGSKIIIGYIESYVHKYAWTPWGKVQIRPAKLANNAALLGAVPLISERST
ncbi:MAG TPA: ROK family protein [Candidatus Sulfotelmatobacter sp.]|nr:ROK family protein [Candidatus Sulfotelmatobacter sp.]